jgi:hypothetical protein
MTSSETTLSMEKNPYDELRKLYRPNSGQEYFVASYFLTPTIENGGFRGMWYLIGTYGSKSEAKEVATEVIKRTGVSTVFAASTGSWHDICEEYQPEQVHLVAIDEQTRIQNQHIEEYNRDMETRLEEQRRLQQRQKRQIESLNKKSMEYYEHVFNQSINQKRLIERLKNRLHDELIKEQQLIEQFDNCGQLHDKNDFIKYLDDKLKSQGRQEEAKEYIDSFIEMTK